MELLPPPLFPLAVVKSPKLVAFPNDVILKNSIVLVSDGFTPPAQIPRIADCAEKVAFFVSVKSPKSDELPVVEIVT